MSAYSELARQVREPMRTWWNSTGGWLLAGMVALAGVSAWIEIATGPGYARAEGWKPLRDALFWACQSYGVLTWLLAALACLGALRQSSEQQDRPWPAARTRALYLHFLKQGLLPLASMGLLRFATSLIGSLYRLGAIRPYEVAWSASLAARLLFLSLPLMAVTLAVLAVSRRPQLAVILFTVVVLDHGAGYALSYLPHRTAQVDGWFDLRGLVLSALLIGGLLIGLLRGQPRLWRPAYLALVCSVPLATCFRLLFRLSLYPPLRIATNVLVAPSYLLTTNSLVGEWLATHLGYNIPAWQPVLADTHLVDLVWYILTCGGLLALLYWLLGQPWRHGGAEGDASPAEASPALA